MSPRIIAEDYNVTRQQITNITTRRRWRHI